MLGHILNANPAVFDAVIGCAVAKCVDETVWRAYLSTM